MAVCDYPSPANGPQSRSLRMVPRLALHPLLIRLEAVLDDNNNDRNRNHDTIENHTHDENANRKNTHNC